MWLYKYICSYSNVYICVGRVEIIDICYVLFYTTILGIGLNKLLKQRMKVKREAELKLKSETIKQDGNPKAAGRSGDPKAVGDYEDETPLEATEFSEFDYMYQGYLIANSVCNNGSLINTIMQVPSLFSRFDQKLTYGVSKLLKKEIVRQKLLDDKLEKMIDVEGLIRDEIQRKKIRIYNQQKHFTKKTMYAHDQGGGSKTSSSVMMQSQLTSKLYLRKERLKNIDVENHPFTKAMVPRLRVPKLESNDTLLRAFERIRPDENEVSPDQMVNERLLQVLLSTDVSSHHLYHINSHILTVIFTQQRLYHYSLPCRCSCLISKRYRRDNASSSTIVSGSGQRMLILRIEQPLYEDIVCLGGERYLSII